MTGPPTVNRASLAIPSRRAFLAKAGAGTAVMAIRSTLVPPGGVMAPAWGQTADDLAIVKFGESVELAAVDAYAAVVATGKISADVLPVTVTFAAHHQQHAAALQGILGDQAGKKSNQAILAALGPKIQQAADQAALLDIVFTLESAVAATYLVALGTLSDPAHAAAVATILPVESQHAVALGQALAKDAKDFVVAFETTDNALDPAQFPIGG